LEAYKLRRFDNRPCSFCGQVGDHENLEIDLAESHPLIF
jgi:hypothetical protein